MKRGSSEDQESIELKKHCIDNMSDFESSETAITLISDGDGKAFVLDGKEAETLKGISKIVELNVDDGSMVIPVSIDSEALERIVAFVKLYTVKPLEFSSTGPTSSEPHIIKKEPVLKRNIIEYLGEEFKDYATTVLLEEESGHEVPSQQKVQSLFRLMNAADYMDIEPLLQLTGCAVACIISGKTPPEIADAIHLNHLNMQYPNHEVAKNELSTDTEEVPIEGLDIEINPVTGQKRYFLRPHIWEEGVKVYSKEKQIFREEVIPMAEGLSEIGTRVFTIHTRLYKYFEEVDPSKM